MAHDNLAIYLNDHLAGSVVALDLMEHLAQANAGTPLAAELTQLRAEIADDRAVLEGLMGQLGVPISAPRKAVAWLGERLAQVKLRMDDSGTGAMQLFEGLEAVSLGIEGKRGLWRALAQVAQGAPELRDLDYQALIGRAEAQRRRVEAVRLELTIPALVGAPR